MLLYRILRVALGITYSASNGRATTLISPPDAVFAGVAASRLDTQISSRNRLVFPGPFPPVLLIIERLLQLTLCQPEPRLERDADGVIRSRHEIPVETAPGERPVSAIFALVGVILSVMTVVVSWLGPRRTRRPCRTRQSSERIRDGSARHGPVHG